MENLLMIVSNTPLWVFGLLAGLTLLGVKQLRLRPLSPQRLVLLPLAMGTWSLMSLTDKSTLPLLCYLGAAVMGTALMLLMPRRIVRREQGLYLVPGSPLPLVLMLSIFTLHYVSGVLQARAPELLTTPGLLLGSSAAYGALSGLLIGRMLAIVLAARSGAAVRA